MHQLIQPDGVAAQRSGVAFGARDLEQLADEGIEAVGLLLDAIEGEIGIFAGTREFDGDAEAGQRRAQFVGDIEQQAALGGEQGLDAAGHAVEGAGQFAELVRRVASGAGAEIAAAEAFHGLLQFAHGPVR